MSDPNKPSPFSKPVKIEKGKIIGKPSLDIEHRRRQELIEKMKENRKQRGIK